MASSAYLHVMATSVYQHESSGSVEERRERRLQRRRERDRERRATETAQEREKRLAKRRVRDRARRAARSVEQKEAFLQQRRDRLATESAEERQFRLQSLSAHQRDRLAIESAEDREARLQRDRERGVHFSAAFKQRSVQMKMRRFHDSLATLSSLKCFTCLESFPGMQLRCSTTDFFSHQPLQTEPRVLLVNCACSKK